MKSQRKPINIRASVEPNGARVLGEEGGDLIQVGTLIPWDQVDCSTSYYLLKDKDGEALMVGERKVFLRFGSCWKSPQQSTRRKIQQAKTSFYRDQTREFRYQCIAQGGERKIARELAGGGLVLGVFFIVLAAAYAIPTLERLDQFQRAFQQWGAYVMLFMGTVLVAYSCWMYRKLIGSSWVASATHDGVYIRSLKKDHFVPWSRLTLLRQKFALQAIEIDGREKAYIPPTNESQLVVRSRLLLPEPKLFSKGFFIAVVVSLVSVPIAHLFYRRLEVTPEPELWFASVIMLLMCGLLVVHHRMELRDVRKANESLEQNFPMNP